MSDGSEVITSGPRVSGGDPAGEVKVKTIDLWSPRERG